MDMESDGVIIKPWHDRTWSLSGLKVLEQCPLQFALQYLLKCQDRDKDQDTVARDLGTTMHYILELMMDGYTIQEAYDKAEECYYHIVGQGNWSRVREVLPHIYKFNRMMHDRELKNPLEWVEPERKMAIDRNYNPVDFFSPDAYFRGVVDYSWRDAKGDALVCDYKKGGGYFLTKYHEPQLNSYLLLDYYCNGEYELGESYIYYIEAGELSAGPKIKGDMIASHTRPWLDNKIETAISTVVDDGVFKHKRGNYCKYCDFAHLCKAGKRNTCGDLIKYAEEAKDIYL